MIRIVFILSLIFISVFGSLSSKAQQVPHYSTYMFNHFMVNCAFAGSKQTLYFNAVQRYQWVAIKGAPRSQSFNAQIPTKRRRMGFGLNVLNDQVGANQNFSVLGTYAYHFRVGPGKLSLGLRGGIQSAYLDLTKVEYEDKTDVYNGLIFRKYVPTADFGMYYYTSDFYASLAMNRVWGGQLSSATGTTEFNRLVPHVFASVGKAFVLDDRFILNPSVMVKYVKGSPVSIDLNANLRLIQKIWVGLSYRNRVALVALTQIQLTDKLRFGYGYDIGLNRIGVVSGATHEFYLGLDLNMFNSKIVSSRYL